MEEEKQNDLPPCEDDPAQQGESAKKKKKKRKKKKGDVEVAENGEIENAVSEVTDQLKQQKLNVDEKDEDDEDENEQGEGEAGKKKRKRKKKKKASMQPLCGVGGATQQTDPPSIPIIDLNPNAEGLEGEILDYPLAKDGRTARDRFTSEEAKMLDALQNDMYKEVRIAAEAHRQTRQYMQSYIKPGQSMIEIV